MAYLGWFFLYFGAVRLLVAIINWLTFIHLPENIKLSYQPFISILIPARNEENNIGNLLVDLSTLKYQNFEIIVYNDNSTDNTAKIVEEYSSRNNSVKLINGGEPENGWLGKNYACHQLASQACGEMYLFLDADVRVENSLIEKSIAGTLSQAVNNNAQKKTDTFGGVMQLIVLIVAIISIIFALSILL
ncbi:MAG: glycosyltransferase family A protein [Paludibacter sp.]